MLLLFVTGKVKNWMESSPVCISNALLMKYLMKNICCLIMAIKFCLVFSIPINFRNLPCTSTFWRCTEDFRNVHKDSRFWLHTYIHWNNKCLPKNFLLESVAICMTLLKDLVGLNPTRQSENTTIKGQMVWVLIKSFAHSVKAPPMAHFAARYRPNRATLAENKGSELLWGDYTVLFSKFSPPFLLHPAKSARGIAPSLEIFNFSISPFLPLQTCLTPSCIRGWFLEEQTVLGTFKVLGAGHTLNTLVSCFFTGIYEIRLAWQLTMWNYLSSSY